MINAQFPINDQYANDECSIRSMGSFGHWKLVYWKLIEHWTLVIEHCHLESIHD